MAQRVVAATGGAGSSQEAERPPARPYPEVNPLMPTGLQMVPPWYEGANFRHSTRLLVGVVPGAILLITVTGTR